MTQQQWDLIGYAVWALIVWVTIKQFMQTRKEVKGTGIRLLLGDWLMFLSLPWLLYCLGSRASIEQIGWTIGLGIALALPYMFTTGFVATADGAIRFKSNVLFTVFLFGLPYVRYVIRDRVFHSHPILMENHIPDIELMLAMYIAVLVIYTFTWRLYMFASYRSTLKKAASRTNSQAV
ncbi:MAG: hypothetical protein K0R28_5893 [Paenibacillus sp.]|nr:hypothetical protein [Paenibacillus sp.]